MDILTPPQSVITAKAQIALLREEIYERLSDAQRELQALAVQATSPEEEQRLAAKARGVGYVQKYHASQIEGFQGPGEVLAYIHEVEGDVHTGGYEAGFVQGVDLALGYVRGYLS